MPRIVEVRTLLYLERDDILCARVTTGVGSGVEVTHHHGSDAPCGDTERECEAWGIERALGQHVRDAIDTLRAQRGEDVRGDLAPVLDDVSGAPSPSPEACNLPLRAPFIEPDESCEQCGQQAQAHRHWHGEEVQRG